MGKLQVVMPMAGRGQRYRDAGYKVPKPLIKVDGKPMFLRALDSVGGIECELYLIIRSDAEREFNLTEKILKHYPEARIRILDINTRGATESVMSLEGMLNLEAPLLILDCDLFFESDRFLYLINQGENIREDGLLLTFKSEDPRYSYVKSKGGIAVEVREKKVISSHALVGAYYWKTAGNFIKFGKECIDLGINEGQPEFYISNTFQKGIESGAKFKIIEGNFQSFGTPEELDSYSKFKHHSC